MRYLIIESYPKVMYYQYEDNGSHSEVSIRYPLLSEIGSIVRPINDEVPNLTISLDNSDGELTNEFSNPPLGKLATLYLNTVAIYTGIIDSVSINTTIDLSISA